MQAGLSDKAAIAATKGKLDSRRAADLRSQLLSQQAVNAYESGRYHEALIALDERAQLVGEQNDLLACAATPTCTCAAMRKQSRCSAQPP